jgi:hypothetical protein
MRRLFILFTLALACFTAAAQDRFSVEIVREFEMQRDQIFDNGVLWLAESIKSSKAAIELREKEQGVIIANASADLKIGWGVTMPITFKLRLDVKDNRYRMQFTQVAIVTGVGQQRRIEDANRQSLEPKARDMFEQLAQSFHEYLGEAAKKKAW